MSVPQEAAKLPQAPANEAGLEIDMTPGSGKVPNCPDGQHDAVLAQIGKMKSAFGPGETTVLKFVLAGQDAERDGTLNITPSRTAKGAFPWATVLTQLGVPFVAGEKQTIPTDQLVGRKVKLLVLNEPGKKDPSKKFPRIKGLVAA